MRPGSAASTSRPGARALYRRVALGPIRPGHSRFDGRKSCGWRAGCCASSSPPSRWVSRRGAWRKGPGRRGRLRSKGWRDASRFPGGGEFAIPRESLRGQDAFSRDLEPVSVARYRGAFSRRLLEFPCVPEPPHGSFAHDMTPVSAPRRFESPARLTPAQWGSTREEQAHVQSGRGRAPQSCRPRRSASL